MDGIRPINSNKGDPLPDVKVDLVPGFPYVLLLQQFGHIQV